VILIGEHAVVYGHPALAAAVDLEAVVDVRPGGAIAPVTVRSVQLGDPFATTWPELTAYARTARERWQAYAAAPKAAAFAAVGGGDPAHLLKVALGEAALSLSPATLPPTLVTVDSAIPPGSGMGSSAAVAVALVTALRAAWGCPLEGDALERLALEVERRQHGLPSGVDTATVIHGGLLWAERQGPGAPLALTPLPAVSPHLRRLRLFDTGTPGQSTGQVVAAVRERVEREPRRLGAVLERMGATTTAFRAELEGGPDRPERVRELISTYQRDLEELGVVPEGARRLVRAVEAQGGAAKLSGAGALVAASAERPGAGTLLVYHPQPDRLAGITPLERLPSPPVRLGAPGCRVEDLPP
jgi:mevalonate kinase